MFAVPGWSVSNSALKQQNEQQTQTQNKPEQADGSPKPNNKNNKRKRDDDKVTRKNVDEMFKRHIEGQTVPPWKRKQAAKAENKPKPQQKQQGEQPQKASKEQGKNGADKGPAQEASQESVGDVAEGGEEKVSNKKQKKNKKNKEAKQEASSTASPATAAVPAAPPKTEAILTPLQQAMRQKLISSRFRHLNETLYTTPSAKALELFSSNPELFDEYHAGFSRQVKESWPSNPVDGYIAAIRSRAKISPAPRKGNKPDKGQALPRRPGGTCTIADLGCGDAQLARALIPSAKKLNLKLLSYDLHAPEGSPITKADASNLPLEDGSVDVAIFCLSLMGTNWVSFVEEAWRVLRGDGKGECWVSEVKSRFGKVTRKKAQIGARKPLSKAEKKKLKKKDADDADSDVEDDAIYAENARPANDDDETDVSAFVEVFRTRGFVLKPESLDKSNKMFVKMVFVKHQGATPSKGKHVSAAAPRPGKKRFIEKSADGDKGMTAEEEAQVLKPCVYKIR